MISKLDPRYRSQQFKRILRNAWERNGIESASELIEKSGIPQSTFYKKLKDCQWSMDELRTLMKIANFTDKEILEVMR